MKARFYRDENGTLLVEKLWGVDVLQSAVKKATDEDKAEFRTSWAEFQEYEKPAPIELATLIEEKPAAPEEVEEPKKSDSEA